VWCVECIPGRVHLFELCFLLRVLGDGLDDLAALSVRRIVSFSVRTITYCCVGSLIVLRLGGIEFTTLVADVTPLKVLEAAILASLMIWWCNVKIIRADVVISRLDHSHDPPALLLAYLSHSRSLCILFHSAPCRPQRQACFADATLHEHHRAF
jgi:hypothetical protein